MPEFFLLFFFVVILVLTLVAMGRASDSADKVKKLEERLSSAEARLRELTSKVFEHDKSAPPIPDKPVPTVVAPPVMVKPTEAWPKAVPAPAVATPIAAVVKNIPQLVTSAAASTQSSLPPVPAVVIPAATKTKDPGAEITLGARWATRMGIGLLVVAVVFFGIYISEFSTPLIRLLEVFGLAAVVTGLGIWLERQAKEFGEAVFAGGLALFYFASFAANAIPAMRVIAVEDVATGLLAQFAAVVVIAFIAWWRNRPHVSTMAVGLGMVSCFFALHHDRLGITLGAALGLMLVAAALRMTRGWAWPLLVGYAGAQACYVGSVLTIKGFTVESFFQGTWDYGLLFRPFTGPTPGAIVTPLFTMIFPAAYFLLVLCADSWAEMRQRNVAPTIRTGTLLSAVILYGVGGWWGGAVFGHEYHWDSYNLLSAAILSLLAGLAYRARKDVPETYEILYAAAGTWAAIYFLNEYTGWIRWLALLLETFIFAWRVRRLDSPAAWFCLIGAWSCSFIMAFHDAIVLPLSTGMWEVARLKFIAWPVVSLALWTWLEKMPRPAKNEEGACITGGGIAAAVGAAMLGRVAWMDPSTSWMFVGLAAFGAAFALFTKARTSWPIVWLSLALSMLNYTPGVNATETSVLMALVVFSGAVLLTTFGIHHRGKDKQNSTASNAAEIIGFLALLCAWVRGFDGFTGGHHQLALALNLVALVMAALVWRGPWRLTGDLAFVWAFVAIVAGVWWDNRGNSNGTEKICLLMVLALGWLWGVLARREKPGVYLLGHDKLGLYLPGILFAGWTALAIPTGSTLESSTLIFAGCAAFFALVGRREWLPGGGTAAWLISFFAMVKVLQLRVFALNDCWIPATVALVFLLESWLLSRRLGKKDRTTRDVLLFLTTGIAILTFDYPVLELSGGAGKSITLLWAGAGAVVFLAGLIARLRSFRYVGLLGLAFCVPRLFFVDITDQIGRIFAFGGLAVLLLAIGFSYHKLRPWLAQPDQPSN